MAKRITMSFNEFMSKFKNAEKGYNSKANTVNKDAKSGNGKGKDMKIGPVKGSGTPGIKKLTGQHLSNISKKTSVKKAGSKR